MIQKLLTTINHFFRCCNTWLGTPSKKHRGSIEIPDDVLTSLVEVFLPDIRAFYETAEGKIAFAQWRKEHSQKSGENVVNEQNLK